MLIHKDYFYRGRRDSGLGFPERDVVEIEMLNPGNYVVYVIHQIGYEGTKTTYPDGSVVEHTLWSQDGDYEAYEIEGIVNVYNFFMGLI